jgi:hypothetical protein
VRPEGLGKIKKIDSSGSGGTSPLFLTSVHDAEWSASHPGSSIPYKRSPVPTGLSVGSRTGLLHAEKDPFPLPPTEWQGYGRRRS